MLGNSDVTATQGELTSVSVLVQSPGDWYLDTDVLNGGTRKLTLFPFTRTAVFHVETVGVI